MKAEGGDRKAAPLGIQIRRSRNAFRVPLLEFSFRVWKKRRVQAWRLGLLSGGKERAPRSAGWVGYKFRFAFIFWNSRSALTAEGCRFHNGFASSLRCIAGALHSLRASAPLRLCGRSGGQLYQLSTGGPDEKDLSLLRTKSCHSHQMMSCSSSVNSVSSVANFLDSD